MGSALLRMPQSNPGSQHTASYDCGGTLIGGGRGGYMKPKIVVIGGSGLIGAMVVEKLKQKGHDAVAASPDTGVYAMTGEGSDGALAGAEVVVDVANAPTFED